MTKLPWKTTVCGGKGEMGVAKSAGVKPYAPDKFGQLLYAKIWKNINCTINESNLHFGRVWD